MRHLGTIQNTGSRVIVVFLQIPEAPHKCLVLQTDSLPEYYRETIVRMLNSEEGQSATEFYQVLSRTKAEGVNKDMLQVLHEAGQLLALPVENILMNPMPNTAIPLREVLTAIGRTVPHGASETRDQYAQPKKFNQFEQNQQADLANNRELIATSKIRQAELLEADAHRYRLEAYEIMPELRPKAPAPTVNKDGENYDREVASLVALAAAKVTDAAVPATATAEGQLDLFANDPNA